MINIYYEENQWVAEIEEMNLVCYGDSPVDSLNSLIISVCGDDENAVIFRNIYGYDCFSELCTYYCY